MEKVLQEPFWAHFLGTQTIQIVPKYIWIRQWHYWLMFSMQTFSCHKQITAANLLIPMFLYC